jgi:predicted AAA+ superfamily ATPase
MLELIDILRQVHAEFKTKDLSTIVKRPYKIPLIKGKASAVIGVRRSGKTYLLYQTIQELFQRGIESDQIIYINLEDDRLKLNDRSDLANLLDGFYSLYPKNHKRTTYIFLDEIQSAPEWEKVVRRYIDTKDTHIILTGSSAKLLSAEIATSLRGRAIPIEMWPFNFQEYINSNDPEISLDNFSLEAIDLKMTLLKKFLRVGGFPELRHLSEVESLPIRQEYLNTIVIRDLIERYEIKNNALLKYFVKTLMRNIGRSFSVHKFLQDVQSQGFRTSKDSIYKYIAHIEDAFVAFSIPLFSESVRKQQSNPRKIYSIDSGLSCATHFGVRDELGRIFENLIYLDLRRAGYEVNYYLTKSRREVDFIATKATEKPILYQVCFDTSDETTRKREETALKEAIEETGFSGELISAKKYPYFMKR